MQYHQVINGIPVDAEYSDENVRQIFRPLLAKLDVMQREKGGRIIVMLAAPPAAGKSTLASFLEELAAESGLSFLSIGIDGFHRYRDDLQSHFTVRDGETIPLTMIKGAPETFALAKLTERIRRVAAGEDCRWPIYDRMKHDPTEDVITVDKKIVLIEGNYLLLDAPGWQELRLFADLTVKIKADPDMLRERLIPRHTASGKSREAAEAFVEKSDMVNACLCLEHSGKADLELEILRDNSFSVFSNCL